MLLKQRNLSAFLKCFNFCDVTVTATEKVVIYGHCLYCIIIVFCNYHINYLFVLLSGVAGTWYVLKPCPKIQVTHRLLAVFSMWLKLHISMLATAGFMHKIL